MSPLPIEDYKVGWICPLPKELRAARTMLDEEHDQLDYRHPGDANTYVLGRMGKHNVVMAGLPAGEYGTNCAARVATNMSRTFTDIEYKFLVGIGGGIPSLTEQGDIRLGDVVVSHPDGKYGGVVQYDFRKNLGEGNVEYKGTCLPKPPEVLLYALTMLQSESSGNQVSAAFLHRIERLPPPERQKYMHPGLENDTLYCSNLTMHRLPGACSQCHNGRVQRTPRNDQNPRVHYGIILSGNELIKNAIERDRLGREFGAKCIEMEAAGVTNSPFLVIRGISDYADSYKNDLWQEYAASTAAAFGRQVLCIVKPVNGTARMMMITTEALRSFLALVREQDRKRRSRLQALTRQSEGHELQMQGLLSAFLSFLTGLLLYVALPWLLTGMVRTRLEVDSIKFESIIGSEREISLNLRDELEDAQKMLDDMNLIHGFIQDQKEIMRPWSEAVTSTMHTQEGDGDDTKQKEVLKEVEELRQQDEETKDVKMEVENTHEHIETALHFTESNVARLEAEKEEFERLQKQQENQSFIEWIWSYTRWVLSFGGRLF